VTVAPVKTWVKRIGGRHVSVHLLLAPGQSPHHFEPHPRQLTQLARSDVLFLIGVNFERVLVSRLTQTMPQLETVHLFEGVDRMTFLESSGLENGCGNGCGDDSHIHGQDGDSPQGIDPHIWLDPLRIIQLSREIRDVLVERRPEHAEEFRVACDQWITELQEVHSSLETSLRPHSGKTVYVYHPAFGYFLHRYGLKQKAVERNGKAPTPADLASLIQQARHDQVKVVFFQEQFPREAAEAIAAGLDGVAQALDPLDMDTIGNLQRIGAALENGFSR